MTIHLVRHAYAGDRDAWATDDEVRPLSERGFAQAEALAGLLSAMPVELVSSSPALRCVQTVEPLARMRGMEVNVDHALAEGASVKAIDLVQSLVGVEAVLCSHGDVIPDVLGAMALSGVRVEDRHRWEKGSVWTFHTDGDRFTHATYTPAPRV